MKKNIGLFADLKNFNTTLPQTKHLNYIMSTNPVGYANGGDVRAGVPSSNMNVTKGFLPMALGFENGGDAGVQYGLYDKLIMVLQGYLGKMGVNKSDAEIAEVAEDLVKNNPQEAENIIAQADTQSVGTGQSNIADTNSRIPPVEMYTDMNQPNALGGRTPTDTAKEFNLENLIQDGKDLFNQKKEEVLEEGLDGIFPDSLIEKRDKEILPYLDNLLNPKKDNNIPQVEEEDVIVPETNDGGISTIPTLPATGLVGSNKDLTITGDTFKDAANTDNITDKDSKDISDTIKTLTGNEKGKDVPKWAIPLMSAGFGMMASKSPYFLQALGEGGQEGIKSLVAQNTAEQDKLDKKADREYKKIMGEYYKSGGSGSSKTIVQNGVLGQVKDGVFVPLVDTAGKELTQNVTSQQALEVLSKSDAFNLLDENQKIEKINEYLRIANNINTTNANANTNTTTENSSGMFDDILALIGL